jgi:nucleotide-binding universal stress UspA family protein
MNIEIKKILIPIDFSDYSKAALKYSSNFAKIFNSELVLIYVVEPVIYPPDFSMGQLTLPAINLDVDKRASEELEKLANSEIEKTIKVKTLIKPGKPFVEIIDTAREENIDLIIIATHGHSGMEHILFGSTADKVVKKAPCPVLTIREPIKGFNYKEQFVRN